MLSECQMRSRSSLQCHEIGETKSALFHTFIRLEGKHNKVAITNGYLRVYRAHHASVFNNSGLVSCGCAFQLKTSRINCVLLLRKGSVLGDNEMQSRGNIISHIAYALSSVIPYLWSQFLLYLCSMARQIIVSMSCGADHSDCVKRSRTLFNEFMQDPSSHKWVLF